MKDLPEGQTHSFSDGCGEKEHNPKEEEQEMKERHARDMGISMEEYELLKLKNRNPFQKARRIPPGKDKYQTGWNYDRSKDPDPEISKPPEPPSWEKKIFDLLQLWHAASKIWEAYGMNLDRVKMEKAYNKLVAFIASVERKAQEHGEQLGKAYWEPSEYHKEKWRKEGEEMAKSEFNDLAETFAKARIQGEKEAYGRGKELRGKEWKQDIEEVRAEERKKIKADLLAIADQGEYEDLRREVEDYFAKG